MKELWEQAILFYNLPLSIFLGAVFVYWALTLLGAVDLDTFDIDLDSDFEADAEGGGSGGSEGIFGIMFRFVNAQDVPVMIIFSLLIVFMWAAAIASNYLFNPNDSGWIAAGMLVGNFFLSAILVKLVTQPLRPLMRAIKNDQEHQEPLIGLSGAVKSRILDHNFGQVEVPRDKGAPALLNAILPEGHEALVRGDRILVIDYDKEQDKFVVHSAALTEQESQKNKI